MRNFYSCFSTATFFLIFSHIAAQNETFKCGISRNTNLRLNVPIQTAIPGEFPWALQLLYRGKGSLCGATLINSRFAIGALQCFAGSDVPEQTWNKTDLWTVAAGTYYRDENSINATYRKINKIHIHPDVLSFWHDHMDYWSPEIGKYDIALLELDQPISTGPNISYICMPRSVNFDTLNVTAAEQTSCVVAGWGTTESMTIPSRKLQLQKVSARLVHHTNCVNLYSENVVIQEYEGLEPKVADDMLCAEDHACAGFAGSGLDCRQSGQFELAGIVSWGEGCGNIDKPGVYTNVFKYLDWIKQIVGKEPLYYRISP